MKDKNYRKITYILGDKLHFLGYKTHLNFKTMTMLTEIEIFGNCTNSQLENYLDKIKACPSEWKKEAVLFEYNLKGLVSSKTNGPSVIRVLKAEMSNAASDKVELLIKTDKTLEPLTIEKLDGLVKKVKLDAKIKQFYRDILDNKRSSPLIDKTINLDKKEIELKDYLTSPQKIEILDLYFYCKNSFNYGTLKLSEFFGINRGNTKQIVKDKIRQLKAQNSWIIDHIDTSDKLYKELFDLEIFAELDKAM